MEWQGFAKKLIVPTERRSGSESENDMTPKSSISAVHDDDLVQFLDGLGVLADVESGSAKCKFCRQSVDLENLVAVFPESGDVKFVCDRQGCLAHLAEHRAEVRGKERPDRQQCGAAL